MTTKTLELKEPFWSAGKQYGWSTEYSDLVGFGINIQLLRDADEIAINTKYGKFSITTNKAREIYKKYSTHDKKKGVDLCVVPRQACTLLSQPERKAEKKDLNKTLKEAYKSFKPSWENNQQLVDMDRALKSKDDYTKQRIINQYKLDRKFDQ